MDPYNERRLRDEVLYLHSLWRRGPPVTSTSTALHIASGSVSNQPHNSTTGKKKMTHLDESEEKRQKVTDSVWTCVDPAPSVQSGTEWPAFKAQSDRALELTSEERATMSARRVQQRGVEASRKFFSYDAGSGGDDDFESEDDSESETETETEIESQVIDESQEFQFFTKLFQDDEELRELYLKNGSGGVFCCLVCRGNGEKVTKKFRNCVALVQHSVTISRTHKRKAHRAYGQLICNMLNWDINKLPAETLQVGDQGGVNIVESESSDVAGLQEEGPTTGAWDVKWPLNKKPTCTIHWGQGLIEPEVVLNRDLTEEEKIKVAATKLQERSREAARSFFSQDEFLDSDDECGDENCMDGNESDECEEYKFLTKLFENDQELKDYYKKSWGSGAFFCMVCWGSVEKVNKRYKDCVGLVQHCISISKTKRKVAHRAYAKIICELLSWDINRLPTNKLSASDVIGPNSTDSLVEVPSLEIEAADKVTEQHNEPVEKSSEKKSWQPGKTINDCSSEKGYEQPKEPKADSSVDHQLNGSANSVSSNELGWAPFNSCASQSLTKELTLAEQMKSNSIKLHQKSLDATRAFFSRDKGADSDDESQEEEEEEASEKDDVNTFFMSLLEEGGALMGYYQNNWENGEFSCLVCGANGENLTKRFKNLVAVVQHSVTVTKSKRIRAHRVYGEVICKCLNWDIKRLPVISSPVEDKLSLTLASSHSQGNTIVHCESENASFQEASTGVNASLLEASSS